jgi:hypothetical protein
LEISKPGGSNLQSTALKPAFIAAAWMHIEDFAQASQLSYGADCLQSGPLQSLFVQTTRQNAIEILNNRMVYALQVQQDGGSYEWKT